MKKYMIKTCSFQTSEVYIEKYSTEFEMIQGLKNMLEREDNNLSKEDWNNLIETRFHNDGYDTIELVCHDGNEDL